MAHTEKTIEDAVRSQEAFEQLVKERLRQAVRVALISVLEEEVTTFKGCLYGSQSALLPYPEVYYQDRLQSNA